MKIIDIIIITIILCFILLPVLFGMLYHQANNDNENKSSYLRLMITFIVFDFIVIVAFLLLKNK